MGGYYEVDYRRTMTECYKLGGFLIIIIIMMIRITGIFVSGERDYVNPNDLYGDDDHQDDDVGGRVLWSLVGKMGRKEAAFGRLHACTICNLIITMFS